MSASVPWSVNAVDPEAWANARDAARRSGQSVGEWLENAIRDAANDRARPQRLAPRNTPDALERQLDDINERLDQFSRQIDAPAADRARSGRADSALFDSIEALNQRIDGLARDMRANDRNAPAEVRSAIQRLDDRIEDMISRGRIQSASLAPELERKLEDISSTIETMGRRLEQETQRYTAVPLPSSVDELDTAIAEIMMRQSTLDGMPQRTLPRREAPPTAPSPDISGIERQIRLIADEMQAMRRTSVRTDSIDAVRQEIGELATKLGELAPRRSLEALESTMDSLARRLDRTGAGRPDETLGEVVNSLHDIRVALAEVRPAESFHSVERDLQTLSSKLDSLRLGGIDGGTVARLQEQTAEIRDLLSGALPSEVLKALVDQIEVLVRKFENSANTDNSAVLDLLETMERRIEGLSERVESAVRQAPAVPALDEIRNRLEELQDAVAQSGRGSNAGIEGTLRALSQKVDATEARLGNLGSIERGLSDLFAQLQEARSGTRTIAPLAHYETPRGKDDEFEIRHPDVKRAPAEFVIAEPHAVEYSEPRVTPMPARSTSVADGDEIPADFPLEPGSGAPRMRLQSAALRVAQSEAALGGLATPAPDTPTRTSDFIAAARRAAQAAASETPAAKTGEAQSGGSIISLFGGRRALLIALTAFLLIFAALRYFDTPLPFIGSYLPAPVKTVRPAEAPRPSPPLSGTPETRSTAQDKGSNLPAAGKDAFASTPPAGVIGGNSGMNFFEELSPAPVTTGSTTAPRPAGAIQTAATPARTEAAPEDDNRLPAALGTPALRAAALAGDPAATYEIGARYLDGRGIKSDPAEAAVWLERAASKGLAAASYRLGSIREKGAAGQKNAAEAVRHYTDAAEAGNIKAMHNLAVMYAEGAEGKPDYKIAARWFRVAADRGVRDSQYNLGVLYARGLGIDTNLAESYRWFALAANQGDADAGTKRDDVAKRLDVQSLVAAKLAVQTWSAAAVDTRANDVALKPEWERTAAAPARRQSLKK